MKNSRLILFLGLISLLLFPVCLMAQEAAPAATGLFAKIGDWFKTNAVESVVMLVGALLGSGVTLAIKKYAQIGKVIFHSIESVSGKLENVCDSLDKAIEADGKIKQNSIQEVIDSGNGVKTEVGNVIVTFTPKPG